MLSDEELLKRATAFDAGEVNGKTHVIDRVTIETRGGGTWAICWHGSCLTKKKEWVYEPMPSSRTAAFIKRTRFPSVHKAFAFFEEYKQEQEKARVKK